MNYAASVKYGIAMLLGLSALADIAMADRPRSPIERRQRPNSGFWDKSSAASSSYSPNRSVARSSWPTANPQQMVVRGNGLPPSNVVVRQAVPNRLPTHTMQQPQIVQQPVMQQSPVQTRVVQQPVIQQAAVQQSVSQPRVAQHSATGPALSTQPVSVQGTPHNSGIVCPVVVR